MLSEREAVDLIDYAVSSWNIRNQEIIRLRQLIFLEDKPQLPTIGDMPVARAPLAYEAILQQLGHLTANPPRVVFHPLGEGDDEKKAAQNLETWTLAVLTRLAETEPYLEMALWNALGQGLGVLKALWLPWSDMPLQGDLTAKQYNTEIDRYVKRAPLPFYIQSIDPLCYYPIYGSQGLVAVVEGGLRSRIWALHEFPEISHFARGRPVLGPTRPSSSRGISGEQVEYHEVHVPDETLYFINRTLVRHITHETGFIPYYEISGERTGIRDQDKLSKAYIWPFLALQPLYDTLLNVIGNHALRVADPSYYEEFEVTAPSTALDPNATITEVPLGAIIQGKLGARLQPLSPPPLSPVIVQVLGILSSLMDRTGGNPILAGYAPGTRTPGVAASIFMEAAKARLKATSSSSSRALKSIVRYFLWLVANRIGKPVYVPTMPDAQYRRGMAHITPADTNRFADFDVFIDLTLPQDDYAAHMDAINLKNNKLWSQWRAMQRTGVEDPLAEWLRIKVEEALDSPQIAQWIVEQAMTKRGIGQAMAEGQAATELATRLASESGMGVGMPFNMPLNSIAARSAGMNYPLTPSGPGRPAMRAPRPRGRPRGS